MSRYSTTSTIRDNNEKRRFASTIIPSLPFSPSDIYIKTTTVERLDNLAYRFYQDPTLWWIIAAANGLGRGSLMVPTNRSLRIPSKTNYQQIINNINIR
jgi:hypothetical protein